MRKVPPTTNISISSGDAGLFGLVGSSVKILKKKKSAFIGLIVPSENRPGSTKCGEITITLAQISFR
jgi:hypothetical protein